LRFNGSSLTAPVLATQPSRAHDPEVAGSNPADCWGGQKAVAFEDLVQIKMDFGFFIRGH
jgi:hypothetical protein